MKKNLLNNSIYKTSLYFFILLLSISRCFLAAPISAEAAGVVYVQDKNGTWQPNQTVTADIFSNVYDIGSQKPITVLADNGDKLIAPGTTGSYTFTIYNRRTKAVKYCLEVTEINKDGLNIETEINGKNVQSGKPTITKSMGATAALGSNPNPIVNEYDGEIPASQEDVVTFTWQWPFEVGKDGEDTAFGVSAANDKASKYTVLLNVTVEEDDDIGGGGTTTTTDSGGGSSGGGTAGTSTSSTGNGSIVDYIKEKPWRELPMTGEAIARSALVIGFLIVFVVFLIWKKRRDKEDDE